MDSRGQAEPLGLEGGEVADPHARRASIHSSIEAPPMDVNGGAAGTHGEAKVTK